MMDQFQCYKVIIDYYSVDAINARREQAKPLVERRICLPPRSVLSASGPMSGSRI